MNYKFRERELIKELQAYVDSTYDQHYATDKYQATDVIIDSGHGTGFCLGNVIKYAKRYGRKGTPKDHRKDLMKVFMGLAVSVVLVIIVQALKENGL